VVKLLLVGIGGFVGSIARYALSGYVQDLTKGSFPAGTLAVNVLGCCLVGAISQLAEARGLLAPEMRALVVVGLLGGFTTFSAFGNETLNLLRDRDWMLATANVAAHIVLAIGAVWAGRTAAHLLWR
jgi:CrcB protein